MLSRFVAFALCVAYLGALGGCGARPQAAHSVAAMEAHAINYDKNRDRIFEAFLADYRTRSKAEADRLAAEAIRAETKIVNGETLANPGNLALIYRKRLEHYRTIEEHVAAMRRKLIAAKRDHAMMMQYSQALQRYFQASTDHAELMNRTGEQVLDTLEEFLQPKGGP